MAPEPAPELRTLMDEAMLEASRLLDVQNLSFDGPVEWTRRVMSGWFAKAFWEPELPAGTGRIAVNCLLNSRDIEPDTLKFLLWHEFLHLYLQAGHTPRFRELERLWPGKAAADSQLDRLHEEFRIPAWY